MASPASPPWTRCDNKLFEAALAAHDLHTPELWDKLASTLPGKDVASLKRHFDTLVEDVNSIEAGLIALPSYTPADSEVLGEPVVAVAESSYGSRSASAVGAASNGSGSGKTTSSKLVEMERRKGIPWTEEEHKSFLLGLAKFGKGDWRSISRNFVRTRTPTQVASHAQKYFIRLNSMNKDRRRSSIHDITNVNGETVQSCQGPITGQALAVHPFPNSAPGLTEGPVYATAVGQPISGTVGSTVGTPVMLSSTAAAGAYVPMGTMPRPGVSVAPVGVPVAYAQPVPQPVPQQVVHRKTREIGCKSERFTTSFRISNCLFLLIIIRCLSFKFNVNYTCEVPHHFHF